MATLDLFRRRATELALLACLTSLLWLLYKTATALQPGEVASRKNPQFPETYIERIHLDLTSPNQYVDLKWKGTGASAMETGPFRSSTGAGWGSNDCNDPIESNAPNSLCTPKGVRKVEGFLDNLRSRPDCRYVTLIDKARAIGFHSYDFVPPYPDSMGCVRLKPEVARLIHDNSIAGTTEIVIDGTWSRAGNEEQGAGSKR